MKIYIESSALINRRTGIGQYAKRLLEAASKTDKRNTYTFFSFRFFISRRSLELPLQPSASLSYQFIRWLPAVIYVQLFKRLVAPPIDLLLRKRADVFLFPNFVSWPVIDRKAIVVPFIHDLSFVRFGQYTSPQNKAYMLEFVPKTIARADHIVTISENSKKEIIEHYKVAPERISIVTPAIDHDDYYPRATAEIKKVRAKYSLPERYILFTGTLEPRKNVQGLLDAYAALPENTRNDFGLVLAGSKGWVDQEIQTRLDKYKALNIIRTGYVADENLAAMYSGASVFVYPSFYEGFGIPPLEAMACGVPVITANNSSLPEVVGQVGILLDNLEPESIASVIEKIIADPKLQAKLRKAGLAQAALFNWEESAQALISTLEKVHPPSRP